MWALYMLLATYTAMNQVASIYSQVSLLFAYIVCLCNVYTFLCGFNPQSHMGSDCVGKQNFSKWRDLRKRLHKQHYDK